MMKVIVPNTLELLSCSVSEADAVDGVAWDAGAAYSKGTKVRYQHVSYESLIDGNTGNNPSTTWSGDEAKWKKLQATLPYMMLDDFVETQTSGANGAALSFCVPYNRADCFALLNLDGFSGRVTAYDLDADGEIIFSEEFSLLADIYNISLYEYNYSPLVGMKHFVRTALPIAINGKLCVEIDPGTEDWKAALGHIVVGRQHELGWTQYNAELGLTDYSRKIVDEFGVTTLVRRSFANTTSLPVYLHPDHFDYVAQTLSSVRGMPCVWVGDNDDYGLQSLTVYGWLEDYRMAVEGPNEVQLSLEIQGLI